MWTVIAEIWRELKRRVHADQVFLVSFLLAFSQYYGKKEIVENYNGRIDRELLEAALADIQGYNLRVALYRLSENVEWTILENMDIQARFQQEWICFEECRQEEISLGKVFDLLFQLERENGTYSCTSEKVQKLILDLFGTKKVEKIGEFSCAGAGLGLALWDKLKFGNESVTFWGEEADQVLYDIAQINFYVHKVQNGEIRKRESRDVPFVSEQQSYDMIVMDVSKGRNDTVLYDNKDSRLFGFNKKNIYSDWIYIQDVLYRLGKTGTAAVLVTSGAVIRMNEKIFREQIIIHDWLEAVITLPANLYPKHYTGTELLIFNKNKPLNRREKVIFIDISREYERTGNNCCEITEKGLAIAQECFRSLREIKGVSAVCDRAAVEGSDYSFKPIQYIRCEEESLFDSELVLADIAEIVRGAQVARKADVIEEGSAYFINIKDIQQEQVQFEGADRVDSDNSVCKEKYRIHKDDILITSKGTIIKLAIVNETPPEAYISGNITMLRIKQDRYNPYVLFEYLNSQQGRIELERIQSGTTIKILSNANLQKLKIPKYEREHMQKIGQKLKENQCCFYREERLLREKFVKERQRLLKELEV